MYNNFISVYGARFESRRLSRHSTTGSQDALNDDFTTRSHVVCRPFGGYARLAPVDDFDYQRKPNNRAGSNNRTFWGFFALKNKLYPLRDKSLITVPFGYGNRL